MSPRSAAVFLSYASSDGDAASRLCAGLRAAGIEVWFDRSELAGGDAWDRQIRRQIGECALFLPLISANTEARLEGYFRREWKQAAARTHDMAEEKPFLLPVVIDHTGDAEARVPAEFRGVQWSKLPNGEVSPAFVARVRKLLGDLDNLGAASAGSAAPASTLARAAGPTHVAQTTARLVPVAAAGLAALLLAAGAAYWLTRPAGHGVTSPEQTPVAAQDDRKSIAVLPFDDLSEGEQTEFFTDGVHEDLLTALAKIRDLKVISRASVLSYRDPAKRDLRRIAVELGVANVLEGSVRRVGDKARITVQLIDARSDRNLWAESYDRDVSDVFAVQGEVAREIAGALKATLTPDETSLIDRRLTENPRAYDLFVRARSTANTASSATSASDANRVTMLYAAAAEADPEFLLAHVYEAIAHCSQYWNASFDATVDRKARALSALRKAEALASDAPEVHLARGVLKYTLENDWRGALAEFRVARVGLPNDADLMLRTALALRRLGELAEAAEILHRAVVLSPNELLISYTEIETQFALRRYRDVLGTCERLGCSRAGSDIMRSLEATARLAVDGDESRFLLTMDTVGVLYDDPLGLAAAAQRAMLRGDLTAADLALSDPRLTTVVGFGNVISEPVALPRAEIAWLQGRHADAERLADEAVAFFGARSWNARQMPFVQMAIARAMSAAGRHDEAIREGRAALAAQERLDRFQLATIRFYFGGVLIAGGRNDEALAMWRVFEAEPGLGPAPVMARFDPYWLRLKGDPRYAEIFGQVSSF